MTVVPAGAQFQFIQLACFTRTGDGKNNGNVGELDDQFHTAGTSPA